MNAMYELSMLAEIPWRTQASEDPLDAFALVSARWRKLTHDTCAEKSGGLALPSQSVRHRNHDTKLL